MTYPFAHLRGSFSERRLFTRVARRPLFLGIELSSQPPSPDARYWTASEIDFRELRMLHWALVFLVIALVAAVFGFGGIASTAAGMAQILFVIALVLFVVSLLFGFMRRGNM
jgi:uncharacterized membrane protein YtjA (UPF0391 family)